MNDSELIVIDGSFGEGGGSILRLGAGLSILLKRPIRIKNIRANRPKSGLRLQHLKGLEALANLTNSSLSECQVGTKEITLYPKQTLQSKIEVKIGTAGNIGLLLQPIQIACLGFNKPEKIEILINGGGTFGKWAPSLNYLKEVTYQIFRNHGYDIDINIQKHGFYPKGGAIVKCTLYPPKDKLKPISLTELGKIDLIRGEIIITNQLRKNKVGERIRTSVLKHLKKNLDYNFKIDYNYVHSLSPGVGLSLWASSDTGAIISSGTILGERNITSEKLGELAANELLKYIENGIPIDNYLSDQLIPFMGFVKDPSRIKVLKITNHTKTNLELIKLFLNRNYLIKKENTHFIIELQ
ncbi:MAG: RNA 3'-phosphate cyclase [Promethearchaeota archaeon Loki_b32]|nr:MAG: RNA 3'-phosphate cyclase [Candidatus Lokiarchaeota archaeon Loki_b32]